MGRKDLHDELEALHSNLHRIDSVDDETRDLLENVASDIQQILEASEADKSQHRSLNDRLIEAIGRLESTNPEITNTMRSIVDTLSNMGI